MTLGSAKWRVMDVGVLTSESSIFPKKLTKVGNLAVSFKSHMIKMIKEEKLALGRGEKESGGIMG